MNNQKVVFEKHNNRECVKIYENSILVDEKWYEKKNILLCHFKYFNICQDGDSLKKEEMWYNDKGELHRDDLPAVIKYYENGHKKQEVWYQNGLMSRLDENDLPSLISYYQSWNTNACGSIKEEHWYKNGLSYQRENGLPSKLYYAKSLNDEQRGDIIAEEWFIS